MIEGFYSSDNIKSKRIKNLMKDQFMN